MRTVWHAERAKEVKMGYACHGASSRELVGDHRCHFDFA
jgi:hypothetical protein